VPPVTQTQPQPWTHTSTRVFIAGTLFLIGVFLYGIGGAEALPIAVIIALIFVIPVLCDPKATKNGLNTVGAVCLVALGIIVITAVDNAKQSQHRTRSEPERMPTSSPSWTAAKSDISEYVVSGINVISIIGEIGPEDYNRFKQKADLLGEKSVVVLSSPGGALAAAFGIGTYIRQKEWITFVARECDSACAAIWIGGWKRYMAPDAKIGFHSASKENGEQSSSGNALLGSYLNDMGLGLKAIQWAADASPSDMSYLTLTKARDLKIDVTVQDNLRAVAEEVLRTVTFTPTPKIGTPIPVTPAWPTGTAPQLSQNELAVLIAQLRGCWAPPLGVVEAKDLVVTVRFSLNRDGSLLGEPIVVNRGINALFSVAAEAAIRAVRVCQPFRLPASKYEAWQEVEVNFDPILLNGGSAVPDLPGGPGSNTKPDGRNCADISVELVSVFPGFFDDCFTLPMANRERAQMEWVDRKVWDAYVPASRRYITRTLQGCASCARNIEPYYRLIAKDHDASGGSNGGSVCYVTATSGDCETTGGDHYQLKPSSIKWFLAVADGADPEAAKGDANSGTPTQAQGSNSTGHRPKPLQKRRVVVPGQAGADSQPKP
jgi:hypothetical protein